MSSEDVQEDTANCDKDDESNVILSTTSDNADLSGGDTTTTHCKSNLCSNEPQPLQQQPPSSIPDIILKSLTEEDINKSETTDAALSDLGSLISPASVVLGKTSNSDETSQKDVVQIESNLPNADDLLTSTNNLEDVKTDKDNLENSDVSMSDITGYKETVIDDVSDSDLQLQWSDNESMDDDKKIQSLGNEALKNLDKNIDSIDTDKSNEKTDEIIQKESIIKQNSEVIENLTEKMEMDSKFLDDDALKLLDEELGIADDENTVEGGNTIEELQQSINQDNDKIQQKSNDIQEPSKSVVDRLQQMINQDHHSVQQTPNTIEEPSKSVIKKLQQLANQDDSDQQTSNVIQEPSKSVVEELQQLINQDDSDQQTPNSIEEPSKSVVNELQQKSNTIEEPLTSVVEELQQLINQDNDNVQQNSNATEETSKLEVEDTLKVRTSDEEKDTQPMDVDGPSEIEIKPPVTAMNILNVKLEEDENSKTTILQDITECTLIPEIGNDSTLTKDPGDHDMDVDIIKKTLKKETETDDIINEDCTENTANMQTDTGHGHECDISTESNNLSIDNDNNTENVSLIQTEKVDMQIEDDDKTSKVANDQNTDTTENITEVQTEPLEISSMILKKANDLVYENAENVSSIQTEKVEIECEITNESNSKNNIEENTNIVITEVKDAKSEPVYVKTDIDKTNDSIKINTGHRITRPDVMLDIPTQEFDFDDEMSEISETQSPLENIDKNVTDLTEKTVTEIVNQLAKDKTTESNTTNVTDVNKSIVQIDSKNLEKDVLKTTQDKEKQTEKSVVKDIALEKNIVEATEKILELEPKRITEDKTTTAHKTSEQECTDNVEKELSNSPSTSADATKISPDNSEEVQEVSDSLGLLAESSRVLDDEDEEPELEEDDEGEGDDEDDDFDPDDESSNQTAEHSEESNPPQTEVDYMQEEEMDIFKNKPDAMRLVLDSNNAVGAYQSLRPIGPLNAGEQPPFTVKGARKGTQRRNSILSELLCRTDDDAKRLQTLAVVGKSSGKLRNLTIAKPDGVVNIVDLEVSSSEEEQESTMPKKAAPSTGASIEVDGSANSMTRTITIRGVTSLAAGKDESVEGGKGEIFNLDSDDEDNAEILKNSGTPRENNQCINHCCLSDDTVPYYLADRVSMAYYGAARTGKRAVCQNCLDIVSARNEGLLAGIKDLRPLMSLRMARPTQQLLEISDSESEGDDEPIGEIVAENLETRLADMLNETWLKYKIDERMKDTEDYLEAEMEKMAEQSRELDELLKNCQKATDKLRNDFYSGFEPTKKTLPALIVHDTPIASYACIETEEALSDSIQVPMRYPKRRASSAMETPAKKQAIPIAPFEPEPKKLVTRAIAFAADQKRAEEDKDISVVRLSAEAAPASLPPPGELLRPPVRANVQVYAMKNQFGAWLRGRVLEVLPKADNQYTQCRILFDHKVKNAIKILSARSIAYVDPCAVRMTIGTRVIALFKNADTGVNKRESFYYSGVIAEIPNPVNSYRYLVFFDDGYAQYVTHQFTRLVYESSAFVWEEVHPFSRDFVCNYLMKYPERPMVRMHQGQTLSVEWNGKWWETKVIAVDAALVKVHFPSDNRTEWIYRGSTRLQPLFAEFENAKTSNRARLPRSTKACTTINMPYVEYTRSEDQTKPTELPTLQTDELRRQRAVAKKSTSALNPALPVPEGAISKVVFYTPKNLVRPYKMVPHTCGPACRRTDLLSLQDLRTYNPLAKPLLSGWERHVVRVKHARLVMYRAPCGRRVRGAAELHRYLRAVRSELPVDLFDFSANTHCLTEFTLTKFHVQKKDLSHGKENVPVPCVNYYDSSLPEFCSYNTERTPTAGVPLNLDPEFLCGCDCEDDCVDKTKCACWKMTLEGARTIGIESSSVGYEFRRLPEPLPSGIYECNSRCKCKSTCMNRVVQNPLQLKLQVFKTINRGWGIRALNDVAKGSFLCIYAGNLLTDATANLDGLNEGDEYLAELDYIEVVEAMKEGYEEDIPEKDKLLDKKESKKSDSDPDSDSSESEDERRSGKTDKMDDDFQPGYVAFGPTVFNKHLRRRDKDKKEKEENETEEEKRKEEKSKEEKSKEEKGKEEKEPPTEEKTPVKVEEGDDCITISDDEEVRVSQREPSRFTAQEGMTDSKIVPSKSRSIRTYFGKDEACYIMDAKVQGNIGRYLNHSCAPNVFVQNVFVDTHDPRFPWVSFFALHHIRAGTELTWNYNYDVGSVPGKVLYCFCGSPNCRGRLL